LAPLLVELAGTRNLSLAITATRDALPVLPHLLAVVFECLHVVQFLNAHVNTAAQLFLVGTPAATTRFLGVHDVVIALELCEQLHGIE
jgi:hypothetical protein